MDWFEKLIGKKEFDLEKNDIVIENGKLISNVNGKEYDIGRHKFPSLQTLRDLYAKTEYVTTPNSVQETIKDIKELHESDENALFQVASQFNCLEMINQNYIPSNGITVYEYDNTQGPKCAMCCGASTYYRNYHLQTDDSQIDCLEQVGQILDNDTENYWTMQNGYTIFNSEKIDEMNSKIDEIGKDVLKRNIKYGVLLDAQVTIPECSHYVNQIFCSAIPVSYNNHILPSLPEHKLKKISKIVLEAAYEATLLTAINQNIKNVYLTMLGGGAFGNDLEWIKEAIIDSLKEFENHGLNINIVSYQRPNLHVQDMINSL